MKAAVHAASFEEGVLAERNHFAALMSSMESKALRHIFFAERAANKVDGPAGKAAKIKKVGVIGGGLMGRGIAISCINNRISVILVESKQEFLDNGMKEIAKIYESNVKRGRMSKDAAEKLVAMITPSLDYSALRDCDMVIEAVFEDMNLKKQIFGKMDSVCAAKTLLCSNTSFLSIDEIASATKRPHKVAGTHFFAPANIMRLLRTSRGNTPTQTRSLR